jgi:pimeloyl-ACP methyl ester carboxylesterase
MKIYAISGLGADARLFDKLKLDYPITHLAWENIHHVNSMADYAKLFLKHIDTEEEFVLMGVSLGSMLCTELAKWCKPNLVILISSAETKHELPKMFRVAGGLELLKILPETLIRASGPLVGKIFGSNAQLRKDYLKNLDIPFAKKAAELISTWDNVNEIKGAKLKIKGSNDYVLPFQSEDTVNIEEGGHFMVYDKADEVSQIINNRLKGIKA